MNFQEKLLYIITFSIVASRRSRPVSSPFHRIVIFKWHCCTRQPSRIGEFGASSGKINAYISSAMSVAVERKIPARGRTRPPLFAEISARIFGLNAEFSPTNSAAYEYRSRFLRGDARLRKIRSLHGKR
jgi:hypothetical protein